MREHELVQKLNKIVAVSTPDIYEYSAKRIADAISKSNIPEMNDGMIYDIIGNVCMTLYANLVLQTTLHIKANGNHEDIDVKLNIEKLKEQLMRCLESTFFLIKEKMPGSTTDASVN